MQTGKIGRQFRAEPQDFSGIWVFDCKYVGMQGLSAKSPERGLRRLRQKRRFGSKSQPVNLIAHQRMTDRGRMDPDLMGAAGLEPACQQARDGQTWAAAFGPAGIALLPAKAFQHLPMGHGLPAALAYGHAVAGDLVAVDRPVDRAAWPVRRAPDESQKAEDVRATFTAIACEITHHRLVRAFVLGVDPQSGHDLFAS